MTRNSHKVFFHAIVTDSMHRMLRSRLATRFKVRGLIFTSDAWRQRQYRPFTQSTTLPEARESDPQTFLIPSLPGCSCPAPHAQFSVIQRLRGPRERQTPRQDPALLTPTILLRPRYIHTYSLPCLLLVLRALRRDTPSHTAWGQRVKPAQYQVPKYCPLPAGSIVPGTKSVCPSQPCAQEAYKNRRSNL